MNLDGERQNEHKAKELNMVARGQFSHVFI